MARGCSAVVGAARLLYVLLLPPRVDVTLGVVIVLLSVNTIGREVGGGDGLWMLSCVLHGHRWQLSCHCLHLLLIASRRCIYSSFSLLCRRQRTSSRRTSVFGRVDMRSASGSGMTHATNNMRWWWQSFWCELVAVSVGCSVRHAGDECESALLLLSM